MSGVIIRQTEKSTLVSNVTENVEQGTSFSAGAIISSNLREEENSFDSDISIEDTTQLSLSRHPENIVDVVDIASDSSVEEDVNFMESIVTPRRDGLRQRSKRACFKDDTDDSDEDAIWRKCVRYSDPDKAYATMDEPSKLLKKLQKENSDSDIILEKYTKCIIDGESLNRRKLGDIDLDAIQQILEKHGNIIEKLSLNKFTWEEKKCSTEFSPLNLYAILSKQCTNLGVLKLSGSFSSIKLLSSRKKTISLPSLREIYFTCGRYETAIGDDRVNIIYEIYFKIFQGAQFLEKLDYTFLDLNEVNQILKALKEATAMEPLKCFKKLKLQSIKEDGVIKQSQIATLSDIKLPNLAHLEIGNGLFEDIETATFEKVLSVFPKLQTLIIHGSLYGDPTNKKDFCVSFPRMDKLTTLSIAAEYEFESIIQNPNTRTSNTLTIREADMVFLKFQIRLLSMPKLKSIILGNLINIDKLSFKDLPNLNKFKVGGPWNQTCDFLSEQPHSKITELQFPDALKDSSLSKRIPEMFPSLKKLWIFLPSVFCLRGFFEAMAHAKHVKIEELYLKTQFDFESTLESCLLGRSTATLRSQRDVNSLNLLKKYSFFTEYVKFYNIELPMMKENEIDEEKFDSSGIGVLTHLKVLKMEHIPRVLRIPTGIFHWLDHRCIFTENTIGFKKYRISQKCIDELPIDNLQTCMWPNFEFKGSLRMLEAKGLTDSSYHNNSDTRDMDNFATSSPRKIRVTVQPSMLRMPDFKVKKECV